MSAILSFASSTKTPSNSDIPSPQYSAGQLTAFKVLGIVSFSFYSFLLAIALYNTFFFLYRQKRYKIYFITVFYGTSYIVILVRSVLALIMVIVASDFASYQADESKASKMLAIFLTLEIAATYAKIIMGFFQVVAIAILTLQVKQKY